MIVINSTEKMCFMSVLVVDINIHCTNIGSDLLSRVLSYDVMIEETYKPNRANVMCKSFTGILPYS